MLLSIIIVSYNAPELLKSCLISIVASFGNKNESEKLRLSETEVIVVDNNSAKETLTFLKKLSKKEVKPLKELKTKVIFNQDNVGFAKANNQGIKMAKGKYLLLLNSDTIVKNQTLGKMVAFMEKNKNIDILGPKVLNKDQTPQASVGAFPSLFVVFKMLFWERFFSNTGVRWSPSKPQEADWIIGAAIMAKKEVFDQGNWLDENIFMYMEEVEWCYRAKKNKKTVFFYPDAEIIHLGQGSSKSGRKEPIINIYRGLIYFYKKHKSPQAMFWLKLMLKTKAALSYLIGIISNNSYLKETYAEAIKVK
jgi:hypothetical protein